MNKIVFKIAESYVAIDDIILNQQKWRNFALLPNNQIINNNDYLFLNIQALAVTFTCMSIAHMLFSRIAYYFIIFQIISIPYFVETTELKEINLGRNWTKRILYMLIIICFTLSFSYTNILNNDNGPLPYKTIFNKEI